MYGDWQESFRLLPALAARFIEIDPAENFKIQTVDGCFNRMYIQPSASRGSLGFCRPVVALDGKFLISAQRATLLIAVVLDGHQKILMLAWALVEGENKDSWTWFLQRFMESFPEWPHRDDASIISDPWHLHQNVVKFGEAAALFYWRLVKCKDRDKWDALIAVGRRDFAPMANYLLGMEMPATAPSPADASEPQPRATMGRANTSRAHGRAPGAANGPGATATGPGPAPTASIRLCTHPASHQDGLHTQQHLDGPTTCNRIMRNLEPRGSGAAWVGGNSCQALVVITLDHPWPDVGMGNPRVNLEADIEEDDVEEADAEDAGAEDADDPATAEGNQAATDEFPVDNTREAGVSAGDHTTHVRTARLSLAAMAKKRKTAADAATDVPRDVNEIPYIAWINKQIAAGRKPAGPLPKGIPSLGATSYEVPRDVPTRGRRDADMVASSRIVDNDAYDKDDDEDSDYNEYAVGTDDEADSGKVPDKGISDSEDDDEGDDSEDDADAPEETQPAALTTRAGRRIEPLLGKQGSQYWARLVHHLEKENPGWVRGVNAVQKQWRNLVQFYKTLKKAEKASGKGTVCKPPWFPYMELFLFPHAVAAGGATNCTPPSKRPRVAETATMAAAKLVCETIKGCHDDAMCKLEGLVRAWMQQDERIARERLQQSTPAPPARNGVAADAPPQTTPNTTVGGDNGWFRRGQTGDAAANPDEAEEVWVRGDAE
ncbi:unnamed protein product [Closterium sp. Yama58-4]|nr:unnamed protein product [Closterium sp. Yama58-4]